jgi:hypothetical protein
MNFTHLLQKEQERKELEVLIKQLQEKVEEEDERQQQVEQTSEPDEDWLLETNVNQPEVY